MAEYPALPLWTDAYLADTMHMSVTESGAYLHLLMSAWRSPDCMLPDDDKMLGRMARCTPREWSKVREVVMSFWTCDEKTKKWSQKRLVRERNYLNDKSDKARRAAEAKWLKERETDDADASPEHTPEHAPSICPSDARDMLPTPTIEERKKEPLRGIPDLSDPTTQLYARGREILGKSSGGLTKNLLTALGGSVPRARAAIEIASTKTDPREYIGGIIRNQVSDHDLEEERRRNIASGLSL